MPDRTILAAVITAAVTGAAPEIEPPGVTRYPADAYPIVSQFGSWSAVDGGRRESPNEGVDIIARVRTPVHAAAHGTVTRVGADATRGRFVEIATTATEPAYLLIYAHLHRVDVTAGQAVRAGQPIGAVGDTGRVPRGIAYLHFELRESDSTPTNPEPLLRSRPTGRVQCVDPETGMKPPEEGGYALDRFAKARRGIRSEAPLLYPVACQRE